jgi:hypothetical protein
MELSGQSIKLFGGRAYSLVRYDHLSLLDHVHQFNAIQSATGRVEGFEAKHGPDDPFNGPVVLLN